MAHADSIDDVLALERPAVRRFLIRLVGAEAADDLTQETFLRAHRAALAYQGNASVLTWLCAIALNVARDYFRATAHEPPATTDREVLAAIPSTDDGEFELLQTEMASCISGYLMKLPSPQQEVLAMHDMAGLTHADIAKALGLSEANSRVLLHRARHALRDMLTNSCELAFGKDALPCSRREPGNS